MQKAWESKAVESAGPLEEKFATSASRWLGWTGVAIGVAMILFDPLTADSVNVSVLFVGAAVALLSWVIMVRPRASAHRNALLLQNMLRDISIPWPRIERCTVGQTLVISTTEAERYHGLGVTRSARTQMREQYGTTSMFMNFGGGASRPSGQKLGRSSGPSIAKGEWQGATYTSYVESRIAGLASRGERGSGPAADPVVAWAPVPIALLALSAGAIVVAFLV